MRTDLDERIASLLKAGAPPERDPSFRIAVLERRERRGFFRQVLAMAFAALLLIAIAWGGYRAGARVAEAASVALLLVALASALVYLPVVAQVLRSRAGWGGPAQKR